MKHLFPGAWVNVKGNPEKVLIAGKAGAGFGKHLLPGYSGAEYFMTRWADPIPITVEILTEWFGAVASSVKHVNDRAQLDLSSIQSEHGDAATALWIYTDSHEVDIEHDQNRTLCKCEFVHELQRLYLALTGEMLERRGG